MSSTVPTGRQLTDWVTDARRRTLELIADLDDRQLLGPRLDIVNPLLWEIAHVAWFQERWVLRHGLGLDPVRPDADALWDSSAVPHEIRWDLPLPGRGGSLEYMAAVHERVLEHVARGDPDPRLAYLIAYTVFHEDMHGEAFTYTRQTLGYPAPVLSAPRAEPATSHRGGLTGDVSIPGGTLDLGATADDGFVFDNERWAHPVAVPPFRIARAAVTQGDFADFVEDGGYVRDELWSEDGWRCRQATGAAHPLHWRREGHSWLRRDFDRWVALESDRAMIHVSWYEAEAYCRWAGRRLPTEAEWEMAASLGDGAAKRRFPWGDAAPTSERANLDGGALGCLPADDLPAGDSALGCRQMIGNVWEWTANTFGPYPGFTPDMYRDYSEPWFGTHKVLRGGCWATRSRLLRNTWRNFYPPDRRDVWAGFRTCAL
jgi:gamma-glutamyl hercynylcysteine S-oxide synthase